MRLSAQLLEDDLPGVELVSGLSKGCRHQVRVPGGSPGAVDRAQLGAMDGEMVDRARGLGALGRCVEVFLIGGGFRSG